MGDTIIPSIKEIFHSIHLFFVQDEREKVVLEKRLQRLQSQINEQNDIIKALRSGDPITLKEFQYYVDRKRIASYGALDYGIYDYYRSESQLTGAILMLIKQYRRDEIAQEKVKKIIAKEEEDSNYIPVRRVVYASGQLEPKYL